MRQLLTLFTFLVCSISTASATLPNGSTAPNFTLQDINGNTHTLYDLLDQGQSVIIDIFATWCPPCWNYNNTNTLKNIYNTYGPPGSGEVQIFKIEHSQSTNEACIYGPAGCVGGTQGDWATGNPIPIINLTSTNGGSFASDYSITTQPIIYKICPNKKIYSVGTASTSTWVNWITSCDLAATGTAMDAICFGDGSEVDLDVTGGFGTATYNWSNGATTQDLVNIPAGNYSCTITEGQGHSIEVGPFTVAGATSVLNVNINSVTDVLCNGQNNGAVNINVSGGAGSYNYLWSNGASSQDLTNVSAGTYTCAVTDGLGCEKTINTIVGEPAVLNFSAATSDASCGAPNGSIAVTSVMGGTPPYMYAIDGGANTTNTIFANLSAGTYTLVVTDANGCTGSIAATINDTPGPTVDAGSNATIDCATVQIQLSGSVSNGGTNMSISWTTSDGNILSGASGLTPTVNAPGTYILSVIDNDTGCSALDQVIVTGDVTVPVINFSAVDLLTCTQSSSTLSATVTGGTSFQLQWQDNNGTILLTETGTTSSIDVTAAGTYFLQATNPSNGCETTETILVDSNTTLPTADAGDNQELNCTTTSVTLGGNSSVGPNIDYSWLDASGTEIGTNEAISVSSIGTYTLMVTNNSNGCTAQSSVTVTADVQVPIADAGNGQTLDCNLTQVTIGGNSSSGTNISYEWSDPSNSVIGSNSTVTVSTPGVYQIEVTNTDNGCSSTSSVVVSQDINLPTADAGIDMTLTCVETVVTLGGNSSSGGNISYEWLNEAAVSIGNEEFYDADAPGQYTLVVTNTSNGCSAQDITNVLVDADIPIASASTAGQIDCLNAEVTLSGSGSTSGSDIVYSWTNENGTVIATTINTSVSSAGTYTLTVLNMANGCEASDAVTVSASSDFPTATASTSGMINCNTSEVTLSSSGSSTGSNFSYEWTNENGNVIGTSSTVTVNEEGTFTLTVIDASNGCEASTNVVVSSNFVEPIADIATPESFNCNTNSVLLDATASSGGNLSYNWSDAFGNTLGSNATVSVTEPGLFFLMIEDLDNGCSATENVAVAELDDVALTAQSENVSCHGDADGTATATASGGEGPYDFLWSNGQTTATVVGLAAGTETVTATDQNGCEAIFTVNINEPDALTLSINVTNETGEGLNDGTATGLPVGGTAGYSFQWSTGSSASSIDNLAPGPYQLTVTDANGCFVVQSFNIGSFDCNLSVSSSSTNIACAGEQSGSISLTILQGVATSYSWTPSSLGPGPSIIGLAAGVYSYTVTDATNCEVEGSVIISEPDPISASINNIVNIDCGSGNPSGQASVTATGGTGTLMYLWSNGETTATATQLPAGNNTVDVMDANGCLIDLAVNISSDDNTDPIAIGQNVSLTLDLDGVVSLFTGQVDNGSSDNCGIGSLELSKSLFDCDDIGTQDVTFTVTDLSGNSDDVVVQVTVADDIAPIFINSVSISTNSCAAINYDTPTASDNCGIANMTLIEGLPSGSIFPEGTSTITYQATDAHGNSSMSSFTISVNFDLETSASSTDVLCAGEENGTAQVFPEGGTPGYQYAWSNGQETATANNLAPGDYNVVVTDNTGCTSMSDVTIADVPAVTFTLDNLSNAMNGQDNGSIDITAAGGIPPYTYSWKLDGSFYSNDEDLTNLAPGNYGLQIQDANGCELNQFGLIIENIVGVENSTYKKYINLSPNPTRDQINLEIELPSSKTLKVEILTVSGALMESIDLGKVQELRKAVSLDQYSSGVYLFKFILEDDVFIEKVILQK